MYTTPFYILVFINIFILCYVQYKELKKQIDAKGSVGPQGIQGIQGPRGLRGPTGLQGIQGVQGDRGSAGQSFSIVASYNNLTDFNNANKSLYEIIGNGIIVLSDGSLYIWTGSSWIDAGDIKGNDGAVGPQGPAGVQGEQGSIGLQGIQGFRGPTGNQGIQGEQGFQGLKGDTGEKGSKGDTGNQGPKGDTGSAGQSFEILGSYANLAAFNAIKSSLPKNVGDGYILLDDGSLMTYSSTLNDWFDAGDIRGPQGSTGNIGPTGATGQQGSQGPTGLQGVQGIQGPKGDQGIQGPKGDTGDVALALQYGSFYDLGTQTGTSNSIQAVKCNYTLFNKGVTIVNGSGGQTNATKITISVAGTYNLQFSLQLHQINSSGTVNIWLRKNNINVEYSNTRLSIAANNPYLVAAWNFFVDAEIGDYYELVWSSDSANTEILFLTQANNHPDVPSAIITINQIGL